MSGVFGVVDPERHTDVRSLMDKVAASLCHREWFVADRFVDQHEPVAIGRVGIGVFNKAPQPVWNASHTIALVMAGEIYKVDGAEKPEGVTAPERVALSVYESKGEEFAKHLNGAFVIAVWDRPRQRVLVANDRFGFYPLFYATHKGRLLFAPEMKGIFCDPSFPKKLDLTALAQYMRFQHLLGVRTFFEGIQFLPNASVLVYDLTSASCRVNTYWTFADIPHRANVTFGEAVDEAGRLLRQAVRRLSDDGYRPGVYLSGGLDSRTILGMVERRPIVSVTYGAADCRDVYYAGRIAQAVGSQHHWFDLPNGEWVKEHADFHLELTEGLHSWIHAHGISTLRQARQLMDLKLTGWDGGTVMGHPASIEPLQTAAVDDAALVTHLFWLFNQKYTWPSLTEAEEQLLYCEPLRPHMHGLAFDSFRAELAPYLDCRPDVRGEYFYIRSHCDRLTHSLITFYRSHIEVRFPFFDYELFEFLYSIPAPLRAHRALYRALIQRETPRLAYIPYDYDEFLPTTHSLIGSTHALATRIKRRINRHLRPAIPDRFTLYADYENYLRRDLRAWAEAILFDERTLTRGIFRPEALRSLMDRHLAGNEPWTIGKIAPLITFELMLRRLYD